MRVPRFESTEEGPEKRDGRQMLLEPTVAQILSPARFSRMRLLVDLARTLDCAVHLFFAPQIGCHKSEVSAGSKQQGRENRGSHHNIGNRKSPAARLAGNAANMEVESD